MILEKEYLEGKSLRELAQKYNVSHIAIRNKLIQLGVELRKHGTHTKENIIQIQKTREPKLKEIGKKISKTLTGKVREDMIGPKNQNWKHGLHSINRKIIDKVFDKFDGICYDCGKILFKGKRGHWETHHLDIELKHKNWDAYMRSKERVLLCLYCHRQRHKKYRNASVTGNW